ncbi:nucleotidyl transferase AbiEii/AbiGii toxin family protein [bacterium]|nr:nucleotidyl transferase AbiEii/AbiGii toxin family protein [bacterium]NUN44644.1 nucleotidyl transferase AbiEii/AbiGii toxin family protein [bacterium]
MKKEIKNMPASVWARLAAMAKQQQIEPMTLLRRYVQERFLYRLSKSKHRNSLILKGAMMLVAHRMPMSRVTKDVDFLADGISHEPEKLRPIINDIALIDSADGLTFLPDQIQIEKITEGDRYSDVRAKLPVRMGTVKDILQIDVGFDDVVIPHPYELDYPVILDHDCPRIFVYSLESAIAEKFEAMVSLAEINSRIKDFFDVRFLALQKSYSKEILNHAIQSTFQKRETSIEQRKAIWNSEFYERKEKQEMWKAFIHSNHLKETADFSQVVKSIQAFIEPALIANTVTEWIPQEWRWR